MKNFKIALILCAAIFMIVLPAITFAQEGDLLQEESTEVDDSENLDIILSYENQSPKTKQFDLIADLFSGVDSDRVVVEWMLPSGIDFADDTESRYSRPSVSTGEVSQVQKRVIAKYSGTFEIEVVATAVKADVNYVSSDKLELVINDGLEVTPQSEEYQDAKMLYQLGQVGLYFIIGVFVVGGIYLLYVQIRKIRS